MALWLFNYILTKSHRIPVYFFTGELWLFLFKQTGGVFMRSIKNLLRPYIGLPKEIYVIFVSKIINALGSFVMPLLTIILTDKIGLSKELAGFYLSISGFLFMPAGFLGGKLADTLGRKNVIVFFDGLAAILYIIAGLTKPSMDTVYLIMFAGASMITASPAHDSLIADLTTPKNRQGAYSLLYMGWNIGFAVGPIIGGLLYKNYLPLVFIGDALTALIALCLIIFFVKETIHLANIGIEDEKRKLEKKEEGSIIKVLLSRPILIYVSLILFGYNFVYAQWSYMLPMQAMEIFKGEGARYFGIMAGLNGIVVMLFTPIITKMTEKDKELRRMFYGGILYAVGFGMLSFINRLPFFLLSVFIFTLGEIVLAISTSPFIANRTPSSHRGRMNAVVPMISGLGYTIGPLIMGKALKRIDIQTGWIMLGIFVFAVSFLMFGLEKYDEKKVAKLREIMLL